MKFEISDNNLDKISADAAVVFHFTDGPTRGFENLDRILQGSLSELVKLENFKAKAGETLVFYTQKKILAQKIYIVGLGNKKDFSRNELLKIMALFAKSIKSKLSSAALSLLSSGEINIDSSAQAGAVSEGLLLGSYTFNKYKKKEDGKELELIIFSESNKNVQIKIKEAVSLSEVYYTATKIARDLVNEQASVVTPTFLAKMALDLAKKDKEIKCTVYDKEQIEKMGMGAFLGVAQAADTPPKFIHLEYTPKGSDLKKRKLAIVGKGITFDSGGISIKPGDSMMTMKCDMAGAAAVLGVFSVISTIKPKVPVMGIIAATPNLISGKSLVPGDVLRAMNGKTIEVLNTDAEGRVTMADSLSYAVKKGATEIIDLATLTGACMVALGENIAGLLTNNESLKNKVKEAAENAGEKVWELPLDKEYKDLNKSEVADIANIPSTRYAGTITAAWFLHEFIDDKPWVHLDIAGPAFAEKKYDLGQKGGTGFGVRTLLNLFKLL